MYVPFATFVPGLDRGDIQCIRRFLCVLQVDFRILGVLRASSGAIRNVVDENREAFTTWTLFLALFECERAVASPLGSKRSRAKGSKLAISFM